MQFEKLGLPSAGGRSGDQQIQIKSRARMAESSHRMSTDHQGREVLLFDQLGNGGEETLHGWNLARSARESQRSMGSEFLQIRVYRIKPFTASPVQGGEVPAIQAK
jgi:hypothetical protein